MTDFAPIRALGLMSGTSMDGIDAAVLISDGDTITSFEESAFRPYTSKEVKTLTAAQGLWPGDDPDLLNAAAKVIHDAHIDITMEFDDIQLVGFHGQTLAHDPANARTHQLGDGRIIARKTQIPVVWDFRTNDMKHGGQGAPLAPFFHFACAKWAGLTNTSAFLNLGGVGNVTLVDPAADTPQSENALLAFDTGPANAPINDLMLKRLGLTYDENGMVAAGGEIHENIIQQAFQRPYMAASPPKSLDRYDFHNILVAVETLSTPDAAATLTALAAACVGAGEIHLSQKPNHWYISGGGAQNPEMMQQLRLRLTAPVSPIETLNLDGDMLEAQAFAYLAIRTLRGLPLSAPKTTGCSAPTPGGEISKP